MSMYILIIPVVLGLLIGIAALVAYIWKKFKSSGEARSGTREAKPWPWKEIFKWLWWAAILVIIVWGIRSCNSKTVQENVRLKQAVVETAKVRQATVYTFTWEKTPDDYDSRGQMKPLQMVVTQDDELGFEALVTEKIDGVDTTIGALKLSALNKGQVLGTWINRSDKYEGSMTLRWKAEGLWAGTHKVRRPDGTTYDVYCDVRKEIKSNL